MVMAHKAYSVTGAVETDNEIQHREAGRRAGIQPQCFRPGAGDS